MNPDHLQIVQEGAFYLARWRRQHPWEPLNLAESELNDLDLALADLRGANLTGATMHGTSLEEANLERADLSGASVYGVSMQGANLPWASLVAVQLDYSDISWANLYGARLYSSSFHGVRFGKTHWGMTSISDCDLSSAIDLNMGIHDEPSSISVDTLLRTLSGEGGSLKTDTRAFFEGTGVGKTILDYLPRLVESELGPPPSCFISYGPEDDAFATKLYRDLSQRGIVCWKYSEDAVIGRGVWANIDRAITSTDKTIVVCSSQSLTRPGVLREIERALQKEDALKRDAAANPTSAVRDLDVLVPVRVDNFIFDAWEHERKTDVIAKHVGDFRNWIDEGPYGEAFERLMSALVRTSTPRLNRRRSA